MHGFRFRRPLLLLALAAACGREGGVPAEEAGGVAPRDRDGWWKAATQHASGRERILAPRELRALLADGRSRRFDADGAWWAERSAWALNRILSVDPDDVEANAGAGRRTLQSIEGFAALWERMLLATAPNDAIRELLDRYDGDVQDERPVFLDDAEYQVAQARLGEARRHLDRLGTDPKYAAIESGLARVRTSALGDYPFVHIEVGPFLVFHAARDLQRGVEEDEAREDERIAGRREIYRRELEDLRPVYEGLLADVRALYPAASARHPLGEGEFLYQWIFGDRVWYADFVGRIGKVDQEAPHRCGIVEGSTGWAYLYVPADAEGEAERRPKAAEERAEGHVPERPRASEVLHETAAYLAALQLLRRWARDPEDPTSNRLDRCRAYWMIDGWASFLAARRVERSRIGSGVAGAGTGVHALRRVVEMRSRLDVHRFREPDPRDWLEEGGGPPLPMRETFSDLAWHLVRHLNEDARRGAFEAFLLSQVEGAGGGVERFEEGFGVRGEAGWEALERDVYRAFGAK